MRSSMDVLRSFKKYVGELALPDFEVRLSSEEGAWERPFCRVAWTTPIGLQAHGARQVEVRRTLQIVCWPVESEKPDLAVLAAEELNERLVRAFSQGLHVASYAPSRGRAHPLRVPIYDYASKAVNQAVSETDRAPHDFARVVEQPSVGDIADPDTDLSRLVIADLRVAWTRSVAIEPPGSTAVTVGADPAPPGP